MLSYLAGIDVENLVLARKVIIDDLSWLIPHYTPSIPNKNFMLEHIISKTSTDLSYIKRSSYMKEVTTEDNSSFEGGVGDGIDIPIYIAVGFMQRDQFSQQHQKNDTFYRSTVVNAQAINGS